MYTEFDLRRHELTFEAAAPVIRLAPGTDEALHALCRQYPLRDVNCAAAVEPMRLSDYLPHRERHQNAFYSYVLRPNAIRHELKLFIPAPAGAARSFSFTRTRGPDFSAQDLAFLSILRPHLARIRNRFNDSLAARSLLTRRENEIVDLLTEGLTNQEIAERLVISPATARTHLNHIYKKLQVGSRTAAVAAIRGERRTATQTSIPNAGASEAGYPATRWMTRRRSSHTTF